MAGACGTRTVGTGSYNLVSTQIQQAAARADTAVDQARGFISQIADFDVDQVNVNVGFVDPTVDYTPYEKPDEPDVDDFDLDFDPNVGGGSRLTIGVGEGGNSFLRPSTTINPGSAPGSAPSAPNITLPGVPNIPTRTAPVSTGLDDLPTIPERVFPDSPVVDLPVVPTLEELNLPQVPVIDFSQLKQDFAALRALAPELDTTITDELDFDAASKYAEQYTSIKNQLEDCMASNPINGKTQTVIGNMLDGGTGLSPSIQIQQYDRATANANKATVQAKSDAINTWAARGFSLPTGALQSQLLAIQQGNQSVKVDTNRLLHIENAKFEIDNRRFAVQSGLQNDSIYLQRFSTSLQGAQALTAIVADMAQTVFNAKVRIYELRVQTWTAQLQAFEQLIRVELAQLEVSRAELENQRLVAEINRQEVDIYTATLQGVLARVEIYRAQVSAVAEQVRADGIRIDSFRQRIEAYSANVNAFSAQVDADQTLIDSYSKQVDANSVFNDIFETQVRAYGEDVRAYQTRVDAAKSIEEYRIRYNEFQLGKLNNELAEYQTSASAEESRIRSAAAAFSAEAEMYRANISGEQTRLTSELELRRLQLAESQERAQLELGKANLNINQVQRSESIVLQALIAAGGAAAQLAASAMSGTSVNAGYSYRGSESDDSRCSVSGSI